VQEMVEDVERTFADQQNRHSVRGSNRSMKR
jgi:hypothetical protein